MAMTKRKRSRSEEEEEEEEVCALPHLISFIDFQPRELSKAIGYIKDVRSRLLHHSDKFVSFTNLLTNTLVRSLTTTSDDDKDYYTKRVREVLEGHDDLILRFDQHFLPPSCRTSHLPEIVGSEAKKLVDAEIKNLETVFDVFKVRKGKEMMGCGENPKRKSFKTVVEVLKGEEMIGSEENLRKKNKRKESDDEDEKGEIEKGLQEQVLSFFGKVQERLSCSEKYISFLRNINYYSSQKIDKAELVDAVSALIGQHMDLMSELNKYLKNRENVDEQPCKVRVIETRRCGERSRRHEMYLSKSIQELDLSKCERCTPSYRLLPEDYPIRVGSNRTELCAQVLNDHWVCVPSEEVVYTSKERRRHRKEKLLVGLEDEIHELDLLVTRFTSATVYAKKLLEGGGEEWSDWNIDMVEGKEIDFLSCVKKIYDEKVEEVIDALRNDSARTLPVILIRLQQKLEELKQYRSCFHKEWADLYAKE